MGRGNALAGAEILYAIAIYWLGSKRESYKQDKHSAEQMPGRSKATSDESVLNSQCIKGDVAVGIGGMGLRE